MRWNWILILVGFSVATSVLNVYGITEGREWYVLVAVLLITALVLALKAGGKYFKHGFVTALLAGVINSLMLYVFYDTYLAHSAKMQESMSKVPDGFNMQIWVLIGGVFGSALGGLVQGGLTLLLAKLLGEKPAPPSALTEELPTEVSSHSTDQ